VFVNAYLSLTRVEIVSEFTKKSGIPVGRRGFQIQFLASRQTTPVNPVNLEILSKP